MAVLPNLSYDEQKREYENCLTSISEILDKPKNEIKCMSHPCGSYNADTLKNESKEITLNSLNDDQKTTLMSLSGVKDFPMRVKCATMAWHTLSSVLEKKNEN